MRHAIKVVDVGEYVKFALPPHLLPVYRVWERWAVSNGSGQPSLKWDDTPKAKPPPLDDATAVVVDQVFCKMPGGSQKIIWLWFMTPDPVTVIARRLHMRVSGVRKGLAVVLEFSKFRMESTGHKDLLKILTSDTCKNLGQKI